MIYLDERTKRILMYTSGAIVLVLLIILFWFVFRNSAKIPEPTINNNPTLSETIQQQLKELPPAATGGEVIDEAPILDIKQFAFLVAERYGSYSSQNDFSGLKEIQLLATDNLKAYLDSQIGSSHDNGLVYQGVTTKALAADINLLANGQKAEVAVKAQRQLISEDRQEQVSYQTLSMKLIKEGDAWRVDYLKWQ